MSMRHLFGFDHIPVGACNIGDYYDTRLRFFVGEGATQAGSILTGGWLSGGGGQPYQAVVPLVINDNPTHVVMGCRAKQNNAATPGNSPIALYLSGAWTNFFTGAEMLASKANTAEGDYFSLDINLTSGVCRRWVGNVELSTLTVPVATLKTAQWIFVIQAYNAGYSSFAYRDIYIGDNADGVDVQVLGDRKVRSLPVKSAVGNNWTAADGGTLVNALNKAWVAGAVDVTASNVTDNAALRCQFNPGSVTPDIDAVQIEVAGSVGAPTAGLKIARQGDATGKTTSLSATIKWGARSNIYQTKSDGSKISSADLATMNFDISGA